MVSTLLESPQGWSSLPAKGSGREALSRLVTTDLMDWPVKPLEPGERLGRNPGETGNQS
jgi:hypothetical protein